MRKTILTLAVWRAKDQAQRPQSRGKDQVRAANINGQFTVMKLEKR